MNILQVLIIAFTLAACSILLLVLRMLWNFDKHIAKKMIEDSKRYDEIQARVEADIARGTRIAPGLPRAAVHQPPPPGWVEHMVEKEKRESEQRS